MNVVVSMLQSANIQQEIVAQCPPTSDVLTSVSVSDVITAQRDHGQAVHGGIISKSITQKSPEFPLWTTSRLY